MKTTRVGIVGLGRLGMEYARNVAFNISDASLVSACSVVSSEIKSAKEEFPNTLFYDDYNTMIKEVNLDCVLVLSSTSLHAQHMIRAIEAGIHVFSEKPLAIEVAECERVMKISEGNKDIIATVGFVRRFDGSYQYAKKKIEEGAIGNPFLVKSQTVDFDSVSGFQMEYVKSSGGFFHDMNVHDVDLARWFLDSEVKTVYSVGGAYKYPEFAEVNDADNVLSTCVFENGTMAQIIASRTAAHGHDTYTEIVGTEGTLRIGRPSSINRVEIMDKHGVRKECVKTFYERFEEAFLTMLKDFIRTVLNNSQPSLTLYDATQATRVTAAMTDSLFNKKGLVTIE